MSKLSEFRIGNENRKVSFNETMQVKDGVECDTYSFVDDDTQDLAIVRISKGFKTPLQRIIQGNKTIEGFLEGAGTLKVRLENGAIETYDFDSTAPAEEVEVKVGQTMQWAAPNDADLVFYEICDPPYHDGRFEDLAE